MDLFNEQTVKPMLDKKIKKMYEDFEKEKAEYKRNEEYTNSLQEEIKGYMGKFDALKTQIAETGAAYQKDQ